MEYDDEFEEGTDADPREENKGDGGPKPKTKPKGQP
jgi:hypothetical protein